MKTKYSTVIAWTVCALITILSLYNLYVDASIGLGQHDLYWLANGVIWEALLPITLTAVGALIISRQPQNVIGWLLMLPVIAFSISPLLTAPFVGLAAAPPSLSPIGLFSLWLINTSWVWFIFPILLIVLLFPTGRPPTPRWRWVSLLAFGMLGIFLLFGIFLKTWTTDDGDRNIHFQVANPLGFIPEAIMNTFGQIWSVALPVLTVSCVAALIVRYARATPVERRQIKLPFFAMALFTLVYVPLSIVQDQTSTAFQN